MHYRVGLPVAAIFGASLLLAPAASPQTTTTAATLIRPQEAEAQGAPRADMQAPIERPGPVAKSPPLESTLARRDSFGLKATLYITTNRDSGKDSIGCRVVPLRTAAVDGRIVRRHTILFIKETVGMRMPDGQLHDGLWYATDVGSAIVRGRIDLYTGKGRHSILPYLPLNLKTLTVSRVGTFTGCPNPSGAPVADSFARAAPISGPAKAVVALASNR
jgi:3D (Asp-Asp-Asp) domain-containing protein